MSSDSLSMCDILSDFVASRQRRSEPENVEALENVLICSCAPKKCSFKNYKMRARAEEQNHLKYISFAFLFLSARRFRIDCVRPLFRATRLSFSFHFSRLSSTTFINTHISDRLRGYMRVFIFLVSDSDGFRILANAKTEKGTHCRSILCADGDSTSV